MKRHNVVSGLVLGLGITCTLLATPVAAQFKQVEDGTEQTSDYIGRFRTDRTSNLRLGKAQELLEEERWAEAITFLKNILEAEEDFWFQPELSNEAVHRSIKHVALEAIGKMPQAARNSYELVCGVQARQLLTEAIKSGDRKALEEIHRRFFHTKAGYEATHRLALAELNHGRPLPAALLLDKLQKLPSAAGDFEPLLTLQLAVSWDRAGMPNNARKTLQSLRERYPNATMQLAGQNVKLPASDVDPLPWLHTLLGPQDIVIPVGAEEVALFRGNAARNSQSIGGAPLLNPRWEVRTAYDKPDIHNLIQHQIQNNQELSISALPALHPLAIRLNLLESSMIRKGQIRNWPLFVRILSETSESDPVGKLRLMLSQDLIGELTQLNSELPSPIGPQTMRELPEKTILLLERLQPRLLDELNQVLARRDYFQPTAWAAAPPLVQEAFQVEAADWLKRGVVNLRDDELFRFNRCLFDASFQRTPSYEEIVSRSFSDVVLMRTYNNLVAIDYVTGKLQWEIPKSGDEDVFDRMVRSSGNKRTTPVDVSSGLQQRLWEDTAFGMLASDGTHVYSIEDLPIRTSAQMRAGVQVIAFGGRNGQNLGLAEHNRLLAHDIRTGKLVWEVGGPKANGLELAGAFFLGPPLPLDGLLYSLAEVQGEIRLVVMNPKEGSLEWSQTLYLVERTISQDPYRPLNGVAPSYADGVLVCPTGAGAIVAVDLTSRSLLWGYRYQSSQQLDPNRLRMLQIQRMQGRMTTPTEHWSDSLAAVEGGRVILTPTDSNELHCVDLVTGNLVWKKPRGDGLYVGGIYENQVLVVGRRQMQALSLATGEPTWKPAATTISSPSGRGFLSGNLYYIPVFDNNVGEVISVDVSRNGRIISRTRSPNGSAPGNLICFRGSVISHSATKLESFHELEGLEREIQNDLARNPNDPVALARRGEVLAQRGKSKEAVECFRQSLAQRDDPQTRVALVNTLLEGLRVDFPNSRSNAPEIEKLIGQLPPRSDEALENRFKYLRLMALGLQAAGERDEAFTIYLQFITPDLEQREMERVEGGWQVQRSRWVRGQLNDLWNEAAPDQRKQVDREIMERLTQFRKEEKPDMLRKFLDWFGNHPAADEVRGELARHLITQRKWLEAELLLYKLEHSANPEVSRAAVAQLAMLLVDSGKPPIATMYYRRLGGPLADEVCWQGKTGKQLLAQLAPNSAVMKQLNFKSPWPEGKVESDSDNRNTGRHQYQYPVRMVGDTTPFFSERSLVIDQSQINLIGRDELGVQEFRVALQSSVRQPNFNPMANSAKAHAHLLVVTRGSHVFAIDTLGSGDGQPRLLWEQSLTEDIPGVAQGVNFGRRVMQGGKWRMVATDTFGQLIGSVGPTTEQFVVYQRRRKLVAVDPLSGKEIWVQNDVAPGCELFGDDEVVVAIVPDSTEAEIFRAVDGKRLGKRTVPRQEQRLSSLGRMILSWNTRGNQQVLELHDPWKDTLVWQSSFATGSQYAMVNTEDIGIVDPKGAFTVINIRDGSKLLESSIMPEPKMNEMYLLRSPDRYLLITSSPWQQGNLFVSAVNGGVENPIIHGHVHIFDRQTKKLVASTEIDRQALTLNQPTGLPVLAFACRIYDRRNQRDPNPFELLCLDKRTGHILHEEKTNRALNGMDLEGSPDNNIVKVKMIQGGLTLKFTDQPWPTPPKTSQTKTPDPPAQANNPAQPAANIIKNQVIRVAPAVPEKAVPAKAEPAKEAPAKE